MKAAYSGKAQDAALPWKRRLSGSFGAARYPEELALLLCNQMASPAPQSAAEPRPGLAMRDSPRPRNDAKWSRSLACRSSGFLFVAWWAKAWVTLLGREALIAGIPRQIRHLWLQTEPASRSESRLHLGEAYRSFSFRPASLLA